MSATDPFNNPRINAQEAVGELRRSLSVLRESVVLLVMRRNTVASDVTRLERLLSDLDAKAALADKINNPTLAEEIRAEIALRAGEMERAKAQLAQAEAEAEAAKAGLPEQEAQLQRQANELTARLSGSIGAQVEISATGGGATDADSLWDRASEKIRGLQNEASARAEVSGSPSNAPAIAPSSAPRITADATADALLADLEARLGQTPAPANAPGSNTAPANYLEFDPLPANAETAAPLPVLASPSPALPVPAAPIAPELTVAPEIAPTPVTSSPATTSNPTNDTRQPRPRPTRGESSRMEPTQRVRVAAIGTGGIFRGAHLPAYPDIPQAQLVAFCDPDKAAQDAAYKRYQGLVEAKIKIARERDDIATVERLENDLETVQICDDISEVIETVKPDLCDICTQPFLHAPLSIQALEAGIHVMCEKPISRSWLESQRLIEAVSRTGKFYQHNENWLYDPEFYTAKKLVDAGAIGEPILMFLATAHGGPEGNPKFWNSDFGGGGALLDNGIHAIGAAWFVSGLDKQPTIVKAAQPFGMSIRMPNRILDGRYQKITVDDDAHILIRFESADSGAWTTAHVEGSWSHRDSPDTAIIGTTGRIVFASEDGKRYAVVMDAYDREARRIEVSGPTWQPWPSSFYGEILNMVESVRNNVPPICSAEFGAQCSAIVGASYLSERDGRRAVRVEEFKAFASEIAGRYPGDLAGADNALVDALLSAVRK